MNKTYSPTNITNTEYQSQKVSEYQHSTSTKTSHTFWQYELPYYLESLNVHNGYCVLVNQFIIWMMI